MNPVYRLHFVGIGGIGMSGIAEIFLSRGMKVSGSDLSTGETTERLKSLGATLYRGHEAAHVGDVDVVVISSAVKSDNPEVLEAKARGIPVIPRAEMLAEIMRGKVGLAIAGTHGKTTTTSMAAQILMRAGLDPTVVVGGKVEAIGSNAKAGSGNLVVAEADESDGSFHLLPATHAVITNIDTDHMDYYQNRANLNDAFVQFTKKIPFFGRTWLCIDDPGVMTILPELTKPYSTYGFNEDADLYADRIKVLPNGTQTFDLYFRSSRTEAHRCLGALTLNVLGRHNVLNALGAIGISMTAGATFENVKAALSEFCHVRRRFDQRYYSEQTGIRIIDDYGHHPTEIRAVLATARQTGHPRIITVFQPHRYSRTQLCWDDFLTSFKDTDALVLLPIYAASEDPIAGVTSDALASEIMHARPGFDAVQVVGSLEEASVWVANHAKPHDLVLTLGAGSITRLAEQLSLALNQRS